MAKDRIRPADKLLKQHISDCRLFDVLILIFIFDAVGMAVFVYYLLLRAFV